MYRFWEMEFVRRFWWMIPLFGVWLLFGGCNRNTVEKSTQRGLKAMERHEYNRAASHFQDAINLVEEMEDLGRAERNAKIYNLLGLSQWKLKNYERAAEAFNNSGNLFPTFEAEYNQGLVRREQGLLPIAAQCFENASDRDPRDPRAHEMLAALSLEENDRKAALAHYANALDRRPDSPRILTAIASVHVMDNRPSQAERALRAAIDSSPTYAPALHNLASLFERQSYFENARTYYTRHLQVETEDLWRTRSQTALDRMGPAPSTEEELAARAQARARAPERIEAPLQLTHLSPPPAAPSRKTAGMLETAAQAAAEGKTSSAVGICLNAAAQAKRSGDLEGAEAATRRAVELVPKNATANVALARLLEASNRTEEAKRCYETALSVKPDFTVALVGHARCAIEEFEYGEALHSLLRAVHLKPADPDVAWMLCELRHNVIESKSHTRQSLESFISSFPNDPRRRTAETWLANLPPPEAPALVSPPPANPRAGLRHEVLSIKPMMGEDLREGVGVAQFTSVKTLTPALAEVPQTSFTTPAELRGEAPMRLSGSMRPSGTLIPADADRPVTADELHAAGLELFRLGRMEDAKRAFIDATRKNSKLFEAYLKLAEIYRSEKDDKSEKNCYYKILLNDSEHLGARLQLGRSHHRSGNLHEAFMQFGHVVRKQPDNPDLHYYLGDLEVRLNKDVAAARGHYGTFLELAPADPRADTVKDWLARNRR